MLPATTTKTAFTTTPTTTMRTMRTTTITSDPGILCFHHCNVKVFCFTLPHICPNCKIELDTGDSSGGNSTGTAAGNVASTVDGSRGEHLYNSNSIAAKTTTTTTTTTKLLLPFRLPYPFVRASQSPCAIVLRPTTGDFLNDYNNSTDLHIAVTTSTGCVVEFDRNGLQRHRADNMPEWWQCLLVGDVPEPWYDYWDEVLLQICKEPARWSISHYHEDIHNCYTFVLAFLQALSYDKLSDAARSKTSFCEKFIVPRTTTAGKYISLYRKLRDVGIYVHPHPHLHPHHHHNHHYHHHHHQEQQQQQQQQRLAKVRTNAAGKKTTSSVSSSASLATAASATITQSSIMSRPPKLCTIEE